MPWLACHLTHTNLKGRPCYSLLWPRIEPWKTGILVWEKMHFKSIFGNLLPVAAAANPLDFFVASGKSPCWAYPGLSPDNYNLKIPRASKTFLTDRKHWVRKQGFNTDSITDTSQISVCNPRLKRLMNAAVTTIIRFKKAILIHLYHLVTPCDQTGPIYKSSKLLAGK